jgi:hypothetical protein
MPGTGATVRGALLAATLACSVATAAEEKLTVFQGAPENGGDFGAISYRNPGGETFHEQWQLTAQLADGALLTIVFGVHNAGPGDGHGTVVARYLPAQGAPVIEAIDAGEPQSGTGAFDLRLGRSALALKGGSYDISVRGAQIGFVGRIEPLAPSYAAGDGKISGTAKERYFGWEVIVPRGRLEGELTTGDTRRKVEGYAYIDHTESTLLESEFSRTWRSLRLHAPDWTVNFLLIDGLPGSSRFVLVQRIEAGGSMRASTDCTLSGDWQRFETRGATPPGEWGFACRFDDGSLDARIVPVRIVDRVRGFENLPSMTRFVARLFASEPRGYVILHSHTVELSVAGKKTTLRGSGYDEFLELER